MVEKLKRDSFGMTDKLHHAVIQSTVTWFNLGLVTAATLSIVAAPNEQFPVFRDS